MINAELIQSLKEAGGMFLFLGAELTALFLLFSFMVGVLQIYVPASKIQHYMGAKNLRGYLIAAFIGATTPFCSCSTIPFLKGMIRGRAGFGSIITFLLTSPLLNPVTVGLLAVTFGIQVAAFYFAVSMLTAFAAGFAMDQLGFEKYIKFSAYSDEPAKGSCCSSESNNTEKSSCCSSPALPTNKWRQTWNQTWQDFKKTLPYLLLGVSVGSVIHGFVPTEFITRYAGGDNPLAIPIAAIIGVPLYIRAEAVIPLSAALLGKGMGMGATMALIIGSAGASLTEVILLKSIFKNAVIYSFLAIVLGMAIFSGFILHILQ